LRNDGVGDERIWEHDASIRCMAIKRTTLAAEERDLDALRAEARRRGISLAELLRRSVAREAAALRAGRRPRFGVASSKEGAARAEGQDEKAPVRSRLGD